MWAKVIIFKVIDKHNCRTLPYRNIGIDMIFVFLHWLYLLNAERMF